MLANPTNLLSPHQIEGCAENGKTVRQHHVDPLDRGGSAIPGNACAGSVSHTGLRGDEVTIRKRPARVTTIPGVQEARQDILLNLRARHTHARERRGRPDPQQERQGRRPGG